MKPHFQSKYEPRNKIKFEYPKTDIVDRTGYRTLQQQIKELVNAGQQLQDMRRFAYEYPDGVIPDDAEPDPTKYHDFDVTVARARLAYLSKKAERDATERLNRTQNQADEHGQSPTPDGNRTPPGDDKGTKKLSGTSGTETP